MESKLAKSQQSLQHIITVILERTFALFYLIYYDRPGYVTCCGIIGSAMFWIGGYLLSSPPPNILSDINNNNDINIYYLASNILPFQTFIHIALLFLASITYWKIQNILSFCMVKCGCFYLFIHSIFSTILILKYLYTYYQDITYNMIIIPLTFISWFLFPSLFSFLIVRKQHTINDELQYKWKHIKNTTQNSRKYQQLTTDDIDDENQLYDEQFITQQYWCYYMYISLGLNIIWYIIYSLLQCINDLYLINSGIPCEMLYVGQWLTGYTQSFTMAFHRAFIISCIYNIIFRPWCHNTVYIAIGATLTSFLLNIGYLTIFIFNNNFLFQFDNKINTFHSISFLLILTKTIILSMMLICEYKLYKLLPLKKEYNTHEIVRKRPTMFDIISFEGEITKKQKKGLYLIVISSTLLFISMQFEVIFMLFASTYLFQKDQNPWIIFNKLLLWSFHLCTIYVHAMVVSIQFNDSYIRASKLFIQ
eukprot:242913_1